MWDLLGVSDLSPEAQELFRRDLQILARAGVPLVLVFAAAVLGPKFWQTAGGQRMVASSWRGLATIWLLRGVGVHFLWLVFSYDEPAGLFEYLGGLCVAGMFFWGGRRVRKQRNVRLEDL